MRNRWTVPTIAVTLLASVIAFSQEAPKKPSCCKGQKSGSHKGMMRDGHSEDMADFHYLLDHRDKIRRTVTELANGVETLTESDVPEIANRIRKHVRSMARRLDEGRPIHRRDPLFDEIFQHADAIEMTIEETDDGLRVRETSSDPYVAKLIQSHARVVSQFLANGRSEMRKNHAVPERD